MGARERLPGKREETHEAMAGCDSLLESLASAYITQGMHANPELIVL